MYEDLIEAISRRKCTVTEPRAGCSHRDRQHNQSACIHPEDASDRVDWTNKNVQMSHLSRGPGGFGGSGTLHWWILDTFRVETLERNAFTKCGARQSQRAT